MTQGVFDLTTLLRGGVTGVASSTADYQPLSYPSSLPSVSGISDLKFIAEAVVAVDQSPFTFKQQYFAHAGERWRVECSLPAMVRANAEEWESFLLLLRHGIGTLWFGDPTKTTPRGIATGNPIISSDGQSGRTVNISGFTNNVTGILKAGDWIQIGTRLHRVLRDANSDGTGVAILDIWPAIRVADSPSTGTAVILNSAKGLFRITGSSINMSSWAGGTSYYCPAFTLVEAI